MMSDYISVVEMLYFCAVFVCTIGAFIMDRF